jgi:dTDP-4-dehydrorhamnose 3,5-epimerase
MPFEFIKMEIDGVFRIRPKIFNDGRGYFTETYKRSDFERSGIKADFRQDNQSSSTKGVMRGLHFQRDPYAQGKLVRVVKGSIFDVGVDLRKNSKTFGKYISAVLSEENKEMLWIPEGFAHGFLALEDSVVLYKATGEYNKDSEGGLIWNDPSVNIKWPFTPTEISDKDRLWPTLKDLKL